MSDWIQPDESEPKAPILKVFHSVCLVEIYNGLLPAYEQGRNFWCGLLPDFLLAIDRAEMLG
jgi:hypothetical protein